MDNPLMSTLGEEFPPYSEMVDKRLHLFTQTLKPSYYCLSPRQQHNVIYPFVVAYFKRHGVHEFYGVAELTVAGHVHYHFLVYVPPEHMAKFTKFYKTRTNKVGMIDIRPVKPGYEDYQRVVEYLMKDQARTRLVIPGYRHLLTHYNPVPPVEERKAPVPAPPLWRNTLYPFLKGKPTQAMGDLGLPPPEFITIEASNLRHHVINYQNRMAEWVASRPKFEDMT